MRALLPAAVLALCACGGLENEPLGWGLVRGTLVMASASSTVSVFGQPQYLATPDQAGNFSLRVPPGQTDLLALISDTHAERISVDVEAGAIDELGARVGTAPGVLELELKAPSHQAVTKGSATVAGTPLSISLEELGEWRFRLPAGCYHVRGTVPGLGDISAEGCAKEGLKSEVEFHFPAPDGTPGHEGCVVSGCDPGYTCRADGSCEL